ncbi:MAG: VapE domain-containing protein [Gallionella sp.]|jgi:predicted P-loop ATPase
MTGRVDFKQVASAALDSIDRLLDAWLPGGRRDGHEFKALNPNRADEKIGSFSINLTNGRWADFADSDNAAKGGDLISLYGYLHNLEPLEAAKEVAEQVGIRIGASGKSAQKPARAQAVSGVQMPPAAAAKEPEKEPNWIPISPVPNDAPPVPLAHTVRGKPERTWAYHDAEGELLGYIWRFTNSSGGKEIVPFVFCRHSKSGKTEWRNIQFAEPRPLYVPGIDLSLSKTKLIVEGEKCADAAHALVGERFDVVTWPGGGKAIEKVDWSRFDDGDKVIIWPDCDAQREKLSKDEKEAGFEADQKPYLTEQKQPGIAAAEKIAEKLVALGCIVRLVQIPAPGEKPSGWDVADAIADGWTAEQVIDFVLTNKRPPACEAESLPSAGESIYTATAADAENGVETPWRDHCFWKDGKLRECRENVFQILQHIPAWQGCLAMDDFANVIRVRRDTPTGQKAGEVWDEDQDFKLGLWLAQAVRLFIKSSATISEGVRATAKANAYHPVREWLEGLNWDGTPRVGDWLTDYVGVNKTEYTSLIGRLFLIGMVARIYRPGCKMDTALILEGLQGEGKSTIAAALAGEWFSDTTFVMGDKDSFIGLRGKWAYELAELDSFNRSESTRAKAFISSSTDSYRAPYDRVSKDHPRQCVFIGTTNQYEYFKDSSGNRRYWPVLCHGELNAAGLRDMREQIFAEAVQLFKAGQNWWPTKDQQNTLISPEQESRELHDVWEIAIYQWLESVCIKDEVTSLDVLLGALKMEVSKIDGARQSAMRVGVCMRKLGWMKKRQPGGAREWVYVRPARPKPVVPISKYQVRDDEEPF